MANPSKSVPPDTDDICAWVEYLGGDAEQFRRRFGGRQIYIPHSISTSHPLVEVLGAEVAFRLCEELTGITGYVPVQQNRVPARRLLVLMLTWAGFGLIRIAEIGEMSVRHVSGIRDMFRRDGLLPPASARNSSNIER